MIPINIENIQANQTLEQSLNSILNNNPALVMISAGFFVPIMEEFVFRYGICGSIAKKNKLCGIIVSALIFGVLHGNLIQSTYAFLLGLLFAFIYVQSGNLIYPILLHIGINFSSSVAGTLFENEYIGMSVCIGITLVMILMSVLLQMIMKKNGKTLQEDVWEFHMFKKK